MRRRSFIAIMVFSHALRLGPRQLANSRTHLKDPSMALQPLRASRTTYFIENHFRLTSVLAKWLEFLRRLFRHLHNGPLFFQYHASWTVGSEGTTLTSGSIRAQRHLSQVSVRQGKFYSIWRQRPGSGVVELVLTHWLTWCPQNPPFINFYLEKNGL